MPAADAGGSAPPHSTARRTSRLRPAESAAAPGLLGYRQSAIGTGGPAGHVVLATTSIAVAPRPVRELAEAHPVAGKSTRQAIRLVRRAEGQRCVNWHASRTARPRRMQ